MIATTMDTVDGLRVVLGIGQLLIGAVAIGLVLRGRGESPDQQDFRGGPVWAVAGWAVFGLLGLVWVVLALRG
jgi:hypothetical protein